MLRELVWIKSKRETDKHASQTSLEASDRAGIGTGNTLESLDPRYMI